MSVVHFSISRVGASTTVASQPIQDTIYHLSHYKYLALAAKMMNNGIWTEEEHDRFLYAIRQHPKGPWSTIAEFVGTRSVRQVQTHTQKYYEKIMRRMRGLRKGRKTWARLEHRIEDDILEFCKMMNGPRVAAEIARQMTGGSSPPPSSSPVQAVSPTNQETKSNSESMSSPAMMINQQQLQTLLEENESGSVSDDREDEEFFELPSLEESLDFFIASLEHDTQL